MKGVDEPLRGDSIIHHVVERSDWYSNIVGEYHADLYVRGNLNVYRRNLLLKIVPSMFRFYKGVKDYIIESESEMHYTAPDIYDVEVKALTGTFRRNTSDLGSVMKFFNANFYASDILPDKLISPFHKSGHRYYYYILDSILGTAHQPVYKVLIVPRYKSHQLVNGYVMVRDKSWTIVRGHINGRVDQITFDAKIEMGEEGSAIYLPKKIDINVLFQFVGNKIGAHYLATFDYKDIKLAGSKPMVEKQGHKYDLTEYYTHSIDAEETNVDIAHMDSIRPYPLDDYEKQLYADYQQRVKDEEQKDTVSKNKNLTFWGEVGDLLISNYTYNFNEMTTIKFYPLINPVQFRYSHSNGVSYIQRLKFNQIFPRERSLSISPRVGYYFKDKQFYWRLNGEFVFWPERMGALVLNIGSGNRIYSSEVLDKMENLPDSLLNSLDKMELDYFKDYYVLLNNRVEILNGLVLEIGVSYHRRKLVNKTNLYNPEIQEYLSGDLRDTYSSFAPRMKIEWTPCQYYYMNGHRKVYLYSEYPTFSVDWERGIKGIFGTTGKYERLELDIHQKFHWGGIRYLSYRIGCGAFTDQEDMYFVDFANLTRNNLPDDWNDDIGGTFQELDSRWYNSINKYFRGHIVYETPFLLFRHLRKYVNLIESERLYGGILFASYLNPYIEVGYGIGTHIFDCGIFAGFARGSFESVGFKFAFELFR